MLGRGFVPGGLGATFLRADAFTPLPLAGAASARGGWLPPRFLTQLDPYFFLLGSTTCLLMGPMSPIMLTGLFP